LPYQFERSTAASSLNASFAEIGCIFFTFLFFQVRQGLGRVFLDEAEFVKKGKEAFYGILMLP
jgi:hypothetical protein